MRISSRGLGANPLRLLAQAISMWPSSSMQRDCPGATGRPSVTGPPSAPWRVWVQAAACMLWAVQAATHSKLDILQTDIRYDGKMVCCDAVHTRGLNRSLHWKHLFAPLNLESKPSYGLGDPALRNRGPLAPDKVLFLGQDAKPISSCQVALCTAPGTTIPHSAASDALGVGCARVEHSEKHKLQPSPDACSFTS